KQHHPVALIPPVVAETLPEQADLEERIEARKRELLTMYNALKEDPRPEAVAAALQMKQRLDDLEALLDHGWDKMSESTKVNLHAWLAEG
ncbi:MAG: hypothetical protein ABIP39_01720, partial [Polyangiaceae bacterium]